MVLLQRRNYSMLQDRLQPQTLIATAFALTVGLSAGFYALWSQVSAPSVVTPEYSACGVSVPDISGAAPRGHARYYDFTADLFTDAGRLESWQKYLMPYAGRPTHYLEVGIYEGRSMVWMLDNALRHPDSRATGVDISIQERYLQNLKRSGSCRKVRSLEGRSQEVLRTLPKESYDVIYVDGSHVTQDVMIDAVLAFDLLKPGGLLIFDDYAPLIWLWPKDIRPKHAIDAFVSGYRQHLEPVHQGMQLMLRKRTQPCDSKTERLSTVGAYCYNWNTGRIIRIEDREAVELLPGEKSIIQAIADSVPWHEVAPEIRAKPEYQALNRRLKLFPEQP
jgi:predicted O-methyltransferase YrrM